MFDDKEELADGLLDDSDRKELEELIDSVIDMAGIAADKMVEKDIPKKVAKLSMAYCDAFIESGFSRDEAIGMIQSILKSQQIPHGNKS